MSHRRIAIHRGYHDHHGQLLAVLRAVCGSVSSWRDASPGNKTNKRDRQTRKLCVVWSDDLPRRGHDKAGCGQRGVPQQTVSLQLIPEQLCASVFSRPTNRLESPVGRFVFLCHCAYRSIPKTAAKDLWIEITFLIRKVDVRFVSLRNERACDRIDVWFLMVSIKRHCFGFSWSRCVKFVERTEKTMASIRRCVFLWLLWKLVD